MKPGETKTICELLTKLCKRLLSGFSLVTLSGERGEISFLKLFQKKFCTFSLPPVDCPGCSGKRLQQEVLHRLCYSFYQRTICNAHFAPSMRQQYVLSTCSGCLCAFRRLPFLAGELFRCAHQSTAIARQSTAALNPNRLP